MGRRPTGKDGKEEGLHRGAGIVRSPGVEGNVVSMRVDENKKLKREHSRGSDWAISRPVTAES